jgi:hypothetical protein
VALHDERAEQAFVSSEPPAIAASGPSRLRTAPHGNMARRVSKSGTVRAQIAR